MYHLSLSLPRFHNNNEFALGVSVILFVSSVLDIHWWYKYTTNSMTWESIQEVYSCSVLNPSNISDSLTNENNDCENNFEHDKYFKLTNSYAVPFSVIAAHWFALRINQTSKQEIEIFESKIAITTQKVFCYISYWIESHLWIPYVWEHLEPLIIASLNYLPD